MQIASIGIDLGYAQKSEDVQMGNKTPACTWNKTRHDQCKIGNTELF